MSSIMLGSDIIHCGAEKQDETTCPLNPDTFKHNQFQRVNLYAIFNGG